jgi:ABC-type molybdenum transport system ATPase subunit/photorepair protein PhrA
MEADIFRHFVIYGDEGSGKMSFIELLSESFHSNKTSTQQQS